MGLKGSDITISKNDGIVAYGTIVALAESPKTAGILYAGTDDGRLQVTKDGGKNWTDVYQKLPGAPKGGYVSRVAPSRFDAGTAYVTIDNHRLNDYETYIYRTKDFGQTWTSLNGNLKGEAIKCITEDTAGCGRPLRGRRNGTLRLDRSRRELEPSEMEPADGARRRRSSIHPRDNAIVLATHGRAIWVLDHPEPIQEYAAANTTEAKLFTPPPAAMFRRPARDRNYEFWGNQVFYGENPPQSAVLSLLREEQAGRRHPEDQRHQRPRAARACDSGERGQAGHQLGMLGPARTAGGESCAGRHGGRGSRRGRRR